MKFGDGGRDETVEAMGLGESFEEKSSCMGDLLRRLWSCRKYRWVVGERSGSGKGGERSRGASTAVMIKISWAYTADVNRG